MLLRALYISLLACSALFAQGSVTIYGTVKDASGSVIPGVTVEVANAATGAVRRASSDERGNYIVTQLPIGVYTVSAESAGFKKYVQKDIRVQVDDNRQVNIAFEVGAVTDSITVQAEAVQVDTRAGTLKEVVDSRRIVELPLNGRNPLQLQQLVPGSGGVTGRGQAQNDTYSINGSRSNSNNYVLDGGDNHDPYFNTPAVFPSPDALEEFSIQTNSYSAEFGRNAGALLNAVTKSGTNLFHGTVFEFLRNEKLNARNFFANTVPPFRRNQFGGTLGGPVQRDRTFFFFSYQGTRERSEPGSTTSTPPTAAERNGDFSASSKRITDPLNNQPFAGNIIPRSRLDGVALKFLEAFVPVPNRADGLLSFSSGQKQDQDNLLGKVDHQFTSANRASVRWLHNWETFQEATGNLPGFFASIKYRNINVSASDTHIIGPTLLNSLVFTFNDIDRRQLSVVPGNKNWSDFGSRIVRSFTAEGVPAGHDTTVVGRFQAFSRFPLNHFRRHYHVADRINWNKGAHFLKFGGEYRRSILDLQEFFQGDPQFNFNGQVTGDAVADFLLARPFRMQQIAELKNNPRAHEISAFFQDDWKVAPRLTLNLGARWDPYLPFIDTGDRFGQLHPGRQSKMFPTAPVGMLYPGDEGVPRATIRRAMDKLAPRIGFAWDPTGSGTTSIRGGYGIFYSQIRQQAHNQPSNSQPFSLKLIVNSPPSLVDPYATVGNPFPFKAPTTDAERAAFKFVRPLAVTQWDPNFSNAYAQQWNFNIQREVANAWLITAAYVGSKGTHLFNQTEANPAVYYRGTLHHRQHRFAAPLRTQFRGHRGPEQHRQLHLPLGAAQPEQALHARVHGTGGLYVVETHRRFLGR